MTRTDTTDVSRPGAWARFRSRQSGCPSGPIGRLFGRLMVPTTAPANDAAIDALDLAIPSVVLEVGFGQGRTVARLAALGHQAVGIDPSPTMVRQARAHNRRAVQDGTVRLDAGDGIHLPLDDDLADAALTVHTIYFMDEPATTLAEIARVLRPGGTLALACVVSDDGLDPWKDPTVYRTPSINDIRDHFAAAGFIRLEHQRLDDPSDVHVFTGRTPD